MSHTRQEPPPSFPSSFSCRTQTNFFEFSILPPRDTDLHVTNSNALYLCPAVQCSSTPQVVPLITLFLLRNTRHAADLFRLTSSFAAARATLPHDMLSVAISDDGVQAAARFRLRYCAAKVGSHAQQSLQNQPVSSYNGEASGWCVAKIRLTISVRNRTEC